jgi:hypothetical protein
MLDSQPEGHGFESRRGICIAGGYRMYPVKQNFSPGRNFFLRPKKHQIPKLKKSPNI